MRSVVSRIATAVAVLLVALAAPGTPARAASRSEAPGTPAGAHVRTAQSQHRRARPPGLTLPAARPDAATRHVQAVTGDAATVRGVVRRLSRVTTWWFQYGLTQRYGAHTTTRRAAPGRRVVTAVLAPLRPMRTYHVRLVASTCGGCRRATAYGRDVAFTTGGYVNPVWNGPLAADPSVLDSGNTHDDYWAYVTGTGFPILHSSDLVHWRPAGTAFTSRPAWVSEGDWHPWSPNVGMTSGPCPGATSPHCYVMYYVGHSRQFSVNCIGVATATSPGGPFTDLGPLAGVAPDAMGRPVGCGDNGGYGLIDPSLFVDPAGSAYLYVSVSYSCPPGTAPCASSAGSLAPTISVIPLAPSLLTATGPRTPLFAGQPGGWEAASVTAPTVEAPAGLLHNGTYYILFSGGSWRQAYGMGYATGLSPTGPFTQAAGPILMQTAGVLSPGGGDVPVVGPHGGLWLVYHARAGSETAPRSLRIDPFVWRPDPAGGPDVPTIGGPSFTPQPEQP